MKALGRTLLLVVSGVLAGCGDAPSLVGSWKTPYVSNGAAAGTLTLTLSPGGTASKAIAGTGPCAGTLSLSSWQWTSTVTTIDYTGTATCTGMLACMDCKAATSAGLLAARTDPYALSADGNTLTIMTTASGVESATVYTRVILVND